MRDCLLNIYYFGIHRASLSTEIKPFEVGLVHTVTSGANIKTNKHAWIANLDGLNLNPQLLVLLQPSERPLHVSSCFEIIVSAVDSEIETGLCESGVIFVEGPEGGVESGVDLGGS